jgi:polysaccharide export outer membrane protein
MNLKHLKNLFFIIILFNWSCTPYKGVPYFQDLKSDKILKEEIKNYSPLIVQPGDILAIHVASLNPEADVAFNYDLNLNYKTDEAALNTGERDANTSISNHLVDDKGDINLPMLGILKAAGHTTHELTEQLEVSLQNFLSKPIVTVRIENFKISVIGDVKNPGVYNVQNEKITLSEGISLAGDLNATGLRNVLIVREINGTREYVHVDLTSKDVFNSPYYYLKNNDVIYVTPNRIKGQADAPFIDKLTVLIGVLGLFVYAIHK